jgi:hypothetical protein
LHRQKGAQSVKDGNSKDHHRVQGEVDGLIKKMRKSEKQAKTTEKHPQAAAQTGRHAGEGPTGDASLAGIDQLRSFATDYMEAVVVDRSSCLDFIEALFARFGSNLSANKVVRAQRFAVSALVDKALREQARGGRDWLRRDDAELLKNMVSVTGMPGNGLDREVDIILRHTGAFGRR